ncbi:MAG: carbohydrate-binding domain-containing protein [Bacteroidales bacterium]|nr:carbohydrate-binding domain-containing protein [Bacteroidales bacterium]
MRKTVLLLAFLLGCIGLHAQYYHIYLHQTGTIVYNNDVNAISDIHFQGSQPSNMLIEAENGAISFPIIAFDSITFEKKENPPQPAGDTVYITYNGSSVSVINPFINDGVTVNTSSANVTVNSTKAEVPYVVSGNSTNGSLTMNSSSAFFMALSSLSLSSGTTSAINIASPVAVTMQLRGNNAIVDNANSTVNGALYAAGNLSINGPGLIQVTGNSKHGISVEGNMTFYSGVLRILETDSDGIHGSSNLTWSGGMLDIVSAGSDGLDFSGSVTINQGDLSIHTTTESQRSIKVTGPFTMTGGTLNIHATGNDCKGIKGDANILLNGGTIDMQVAGEGSNGISSDTDVTISGADITIVSTSADGKGIKSDSTFHMSSGNLNITHSGNTSKGIAADSDLSISGGTIVINSNGSTVVTDYDPSYCTAIRSDSNINISGGDITITLPTSNQGGKGIKATGNMTISGDNSINIETHGDGATYTAASGNDTYSSSCLRSEGDMQILSGNITLTSTGKGGKGIKVGTKTATGSGWGGTTYTYSGTYTQGSSDGTGPILTISTTGTQVGSGGGGGWPPGGGSSASASAKAIKVGGVATIYGGTTTVTTTKSGAEGLESKTQINIEGGQHYFKCYDDCINSKGKIFFNGGVTVCFSNGNDAIDSNAGTAGAITIGDGVVFSYTTKGSPEEGFDCDNNSYIRITGTGIGISAGGSQGGGGGWPGGGGGGNTITGAVQGYYFHTSSYSFQAGRYYTLSNTSGAGGTNMVTFSFEANCTSNLALITATGMAHGSTYYVKYGTSAPTNPTTAFHGIYLGGTTSASTQAFSFTAQ